MGKFIVSARKFRPNRFDEVVGQTHVTQTIKNAIAADKLAHAFLFCGPRGVGKTTCARILAKVLNCENGNDENEPCNECNSCKSFDQNASFNIIELDAASNNSVDHMRQLIEQTRFQPQKGKYKVFIIDEVHMLSQSAFNSFLKTLEEPPPYAIFILATTEKHKIIPTILSRCQVYDFRRIQIPEIVSTLKGICTKEGIEAEDEALHIIAQKGDGSLRDALSLFDRQTNVSSSKITYDAVIENLNVLDYDYFFKALESVLVEDFGNLITLYNQILSDGFEPDTFSLGLASHIRNLLISKKLDNLDLLHAGEALEQRYRNQAKLASESLLLNGLHILNECDVHYKMAKNKALHVEMALIRFLYVNNMIDVASKKKSQPNPVESKPESKPEFKQESKQETIKVRDESLLSKPKEKTASPAPLLEIKKEVKEPAPKKVDIVEKLVPQKAPVVGLLVPDLSSISSIKEEILSEEKANQLKESVPVTFESIMEIWNSYAQNDASLTVKNALKQVKVSYTEEAGLNVTTGSNVTRNLILKELDLMEKIRTTLGAPDLKLAITIDDTLSANKVKPTKKPLSYKEKYQKLVEKNPLIKDLKDRFDLKIDR